MVGLISSHCAIEEIELFVQGKLDEPKLSQVRKHSKSCELCRKVWDECLENAEIAGQLRRALADTPRRILPTYEDSVNEMEQMDGYRLIRKIHQGGQGVVYEAFQKATRRKVAIKVLLGGSFAKEVSKRRFEREIELAANLHHRNIVSIHDSGITRGNYYFTMDFVEGERLDNYVSNRKLSIHEKLELFCKVCEAVNFAHQRGVIHRDLKPSNILVNAEGEPFILDFGLARRMEDSEFSSFSLDGQLLGTPQYMSPEQAEGKVTDHDVRTDVYALGLILYKMLTGEHPYPVNGGISEVLNNIMKADPIRPSTLCRNLDTDIEIIILKSLAKDTNQRYQSVGELHRDIQFWLQGLPIVARSISSVYLLKKLIARHQYTSIVGVLLLVIIIGFACISFELYRTAEAARIESEGVRKKLTNEMSNNFAFIRSTGFTIFLQSWRAGRLREAHEISQVLTENSREWLGAKFLMDFHWTAEKETIFRHKLGTAQTAFAEFVLGEFYLKQGDLPQAFERFQKCKALLSSNDSDLWMKMRVKNRLAELSSVKNQKENPSEATK